MNKIYLLVANLLCCVVASEAAQLSASVTEKLSAAAARSSAAEGQQQQSSAKMSIEDFAKLSPLKKCEQLFALTAGFDELIKKNLTKGFAFMVMADAICQNLQKNHSGLEVDAVELINNELFYHKVSRHRTVAQVALASVVASQDAEGTPGKQFMESYKALKVFAMRESDANKIALEQSYAEISSAVSPGDPSGGYVSLSAKWREQGDKALQFSEGVLNRSIEETTVVIKTFGLLIDSANEHQAATGDKTYSIKARIAALSFVTNLAQPLENSEEFGTNSWTAVRGYIDHKKNLIEQISKKLPVEKPFDNALSGAQIPPLVVFHEMYV